jgi:hypothetical protein
VVPVFLWGVAGEDALEFLAVAADGVERAVVQAR